MAKHKSKNKGMDPEKHYLNVMTNHVLYPKAKELGISPQDREKWRALLKLVQKDLVKRFRSITPEEALQDMSFKQRRMLGMDKEKKPTQNKFKCPNDKITRKVVRKSYSSDQEIAKTIKGADERLTTWICGRREEALKKVNQHEMSLVNTLGKFHIRAFLKWPFHTQEPYNTFFSNVYLPDMKIAIEVYPTIKEFAGTDLKDKCFSILGIKHIILTNTEAHNADVLDIIRHKAAI